MAAQGNKTKWGSFLSQAVAGVEARLDTILADEEAEKNQAAPKPTSSPAPSQQSTSTTPQRTNSQRSKPQDRLQERLARAVAAKQAAAAQQQASTSKPTPIASPRQSTDLPSRASLDSITPSLPSDQGNGRSSLESQTRPSHDVQRTNTFGAIVNGSETEVPLETPTSNGHIEDEEPPLSPVKSVIRDEDELRLVETSTRRVKQLEQNLEELRLAQQIEVHTYIEQIDALQAKLQYLAREATDGARKAAQDAPAGSTEKLLAQKDEQIGGLMEEGKKLAVNEQKLRTVIKTLRAKVTADEKEVNEAATSRIKLEAELEATKKKARKVDELEKYQQELHRRIGTSQKDIEFLKAEVNTRDNTVASLKTQLQQASNEAKALTLKINDEALAKERQKVRELQDTVADFRVEKDLMADRGKAQAQELVEKAERITERARATELELQNELRALESKLEFSRVRAEEVSSGAMGDSQAKLLRQVETLQTQYAVASDNWQGIESTLLARVGSLEKERDEAQQRESDMRKKARDAAVRAKRQEEDLEDAKLRLSSIQDDEKSIQSERDSLKRTAQRSEVGLKEARDEVEKLKSALKEAKSSARDNDRASIVGTPWLDEFPANNHRPNSRPESPLTSAHPARTMSSDFLGLSSLAGKWRKPSAASSNGDPLERFALSRRPSMAPHSHTRPSIVIASGSTPPVPSIHSPSISEAMPTPSIRRFERSETFDSVEAPSSPRQIAQDMISVSTVGAGPSVQLVERMSAAVRRLETEKVAAKEEVARMIKSRDEGRAEIATLLRDQDAGRAATTRVAELEAEVASVKERYETTLQMFGEKTELVDELRADITDLKSMYRELVERTVK